MSKKETLFDMLCKPEFPIDAMEDYAERVESGEFKGLTDDQIREIYKQEALDAEEAADLLDLQAQFPNDD